MITSIAIENFKGIRERIAIELKPITLFFGPNSAGKSTILHALHYAREIFERHNLNADQTLVGGKCIDLGGFRNFVHGRDLSRSVVLWFEMDLRYRDLPSYSFVEGEGFQGYLTDVETPEVAQGVRSASVEVAVSWSELRQSFYVQRYAVWLNDEPLATIQSYFERHQVELAEVNFQHPVLQVAGESGSLGEALEVLESRPLPHTIPIENQGDALPTWGQALPLILFPDGTDEIRSSGVDGVQQAQVAADTLVALFSQLVVGPGQLLRDALQQFRYLGPLRETPPRNFACPRFPDPSRWANGVAAWDLLHSDAELAKRVSSWLSGPDSLETGYTVRVKRYKELPLDSPLIVLLRSDRAFDELEDIRSLIDKLPTKSSVTLVEDNSNIEVLPHDVGVGISQLIPVVVLAIDQRTGLAAIEQPELHIHPAIQVRLGDLFVQQITTDSSRRFLLETHSEHLLLRLLRRIRETSEGDLPPGHPGLKPEQVSVIYVKASPEVEGGQGEGDGAPHLRLHPLRIDETGEFIDCWPRGLFDERAEELF
jgi:hypothetical protein